MRACVRACVYLVSKFFFFCCFVVVQQKEIDSLNAALQCRSITSSPHSVIADPSGFIRPPVLRFPDTTVSFDFGPPTPIAAPALNTSYQLGDI